MCASTFCVRCAHAKSKRLCFSTVFSAYLFPHILLNYFHIFWISVELKSAKCQAQGETGEHEREATGTSNGGGGQDQQQRKINSRVNSRKLNQFNFVAFIASPHCKKHFVHKCIDIRQPNSAKEINKRDVWEWAAEAAECTKTALYCICNLCVVESLMLKALKEIKKKQQAINKKIKSLAFCVSTFWNSCPRSNFIRANEYWNSMAVQCACFRWQLHHKASAQVFLSWFFFK